MVWNADSRCLRDYCPSQNTSTKVQTQDLTAKKSKPKESKPKDLKQADRKTPAPPRTNKPGKTSRQDKKKEYLKKMQDRKNPIPATENNAIEGKKKRNNWGNKKCYNCQKKGRFAWNYPKSPKYSCWSWQPPCWWLVVMRKSSSGCPTSIIRFNSRRNR